MSVAEGLLVPALCLGHPGQVLVGAGLPGVAADFVEQAQCAQVVGAGVVGAVQPVLGESETAMGVGLSRLVALAQRGVQGRAVDDGLDPATRTGWSVVVAGAVSDPAELARYRTVLTPWVDTEMEHVVRIGADIVTGFRLVGGELDS